MENPYEMIGQFLGGYYHQDARDDFETDKEIWNQFVEDSATSEVQQLICEIELLLKQDDQALMTFINKVTDYGAKSFGNVKNAKQFLSELKEYLTEKINF